MKHKLNLQIYFAIFSLILASACAPTDTANERPLSKSPQSAPPNLTANDPTTTLPTLDGTGDTGGGNGFRDKVFESYRRDITHSDEWKQFIEPIAASLSKARRWGSKNLLTALADSKRWYFVPMKLSALSNSKIGIGFIQDPSHQLALTTAKEVWVDSTAFKGANAEQRGYLFLHELMVHFYSLKSQSIEQVCRVFLSPGKCPPNPAHSKELFKTPGQALGSLTPNDYANIRSMTAWLLSRREKITLESYYSQLQKFEFDPRFVDPSIVFPEYFPSQAKQISWTSHQIRKAISTAVLSGRMPVFCGYAQTLIARSECKFSIEENSERSFTLLLTEKPAHHPPVSSHSPQNDRSLLPLPESKKPKHLKYPFKIFDEIAYGPVFALPYGHGPKGLFSLVLRHQPPTDPQVGQVLHDMQIYYFGGNPTLIDAIEVIAIYLQPLIITETQRDDEGRLTYTYTSSKIDPPDETHFIYYKRHLPVNPFDLSSSSSGTQSATVK